MQNLSYVNELDLRENEPVGETHFHVNSFTLRLVLIQRQKASLKWPIAQSFMENHSNNLLSLHCQGISDSTRTKRLISIR